MGYGVGEALASPASHAIPTKRPRRFDLTPSPAHERARDGCRAGLAGLCAERGAERLAPRPRRRPCDAGCLGPVHIAEALLFAAAAGLANVTFYEIDLSTLAESVQ